MHGIHEAPLMVTPCSPVFGDVIVDPGLDRSHPPDHAGGHRHRIVRVEIRRLLGELLSRSSLRLREDGRGRLVFPNRRRVEAGVVTQNRGVPFWPVVADSYALLDERVVPRHELHDSLFAAEQFVIEPHAFAADRPATFGCQVAFQFLTGAHHRFPNADLDLPIETIPGSGIEVVRTTNFPLQFFELNACRIGVGRHQCADRPEPHGRVLLQGLGPHFSHRGQISQLVRDPIVNARIRRTGCRRRGSGLRWRGGEVLDRFGGWRSVFVVGERLLQALHGDRLHERRLHVIGIASQRRRGQAKCRAVSPGRLRLFREGSQG